MSNGDNTPDFIPVDKGTPDFVPVAKPKSLYEKATTPLVKSETILKGTSYQGEKAKAEKAIAEGGKPWTAGFWTFGAGVDKSISDLIASFTSPASIGLAAASGGESTLGQGVGKTLLRSLGLAGAGLFGAKGAKEAVTSRQKGETQADALERRLMGASTAAISAAGAGAVGRDAVHGILRRSLKLDEDLATKVSERVTKAQQERAKAQTQKGIRKATMQSLEDAKMKAGGDLLADTAHALVQEQARVSQPFHDIALQIKDPITDTGSMRTIVEQAFKDAGANPSEIPPAALKALGPDEGPPSITLMGKKTPISSLSPQMQQRLGIKGTGDNVTFSDLTRVREDLGAAAKASKDTAVKRALFEAQEKVSNIQEKVAQQKGLGKQYKAAKEEYFKFKRGIGSDLISDWLSAYDIEDQALAPKVSKLFNKSTSQALRTVLRTSGLDTKALDSIVESMQETKTSGKVSATEERRAIGKAESTKDIIPGTKAGDLAQMPNEDLLRARLQAQANSMKEAGIREPFALMQYAIGIFQLMRGSAFGSYHLARAGAMTIIPEKIKTPEFQDWLMDKAGIEDRVLTKKITDNLYLAVRQAAKSGVLPQATATTGDRKRSNPSTPPQ